MHTLSLTTLLNTFPDALIIQTHRHPVLVCNSSNSFRYSSYGMVIKKIDVPRMGERNIARIESLAPSSLKFRESNRNVIYDVYYDQLVSDPIYAVRSIYSHFGLVWSDDFEEYLKAYCGKTHRANRGSIATAQLILG